MRRLLSPLVLLAALSVWFPATGNAATATTTFNVSATIVSACNSLTASDLAFGNYNPATGLPNDSTNLITITCTLLTPYTIALNAGLHSSGSFTNRKMENVSNLGEFLNYNIYTSALRTTVWGDGTSSTSTVAGVGTGLAGSTTAYGRIPAGQNDSPGNYGDTITVTVTY